jgi:small subunit ribosomal protein S3Ae
MVRVFPNDSITETLTKKIGKECGPIFPLQNVLIRKMKMLKKPKFDYTKLMELYTEKDDKKKKSKAAKEEVAEEGDDAESNLLKK